MQDLSSLRSLGRSRTASQPLLLLLLRWARLPWWRRGSLGPRRWRRLLLPRLPVRRGHNTRLSSCAFSPPRVPPWSLLLRSLPPGGGCTSPRLPPSRMCALALALCWCAAAGIFAPAPKPALSGASRNAPALRSPLVGRVPWPVGAACGTCGPVAGSWWSLAVKPRLRLPLKHRFSAMPPHTRNTPLLRRRAPQPKLQPTLRWLLAWQRGATTVLR